MIGVLAPDGISMWRCGDAIMEALWRAYECPPGAVVPLPGGVVCAAQSDTPSVEKVSGEVADVRHDLAEERVAIMEYEGGLPRKVAEAVAFIAHGLPFPEVKRL